MERPRAAYFRYEGPGVLVARAKASEPVTPLGKALARIRRSLLGRPLATEEEIGERLSKRKALAIFSSDAISSSAYATEEILRVLVLAGAAALTFSLGIAIAIAVMLAVVSTSYRQIGYAYPSGGGAYAVGKANLGRYAALIAAAALLVDYIMTVAVSTSSGVEQITSALPSLAPLNVEIGVVRRRPHHAGQPAGHPRVGQHLRRPDVPVRGQRPADGRHRRGPHRLPGGRRGAA